MSMDEDTVAEGGGVTTADASAATMADKETVAVKVSGGVGVAAAAAAVAAVAGGERRGVAGEETRVGSAPAGVMAVEGVEVGT